MAYTTSDAQTELAYRLGESAAPTSVTELARRRSWFRNAISKAAGGDQLMWFLQEYSTDITITDTPSYSLPTSWRVFNQVKIDNYKYEQIEQEDVFERYELPLSPVKLDTIDLDRSFYVWDNAMYILPVADAPTALTGTATASGTTATLTTTTAHGWAIGQHVKITGGTETKYNVTDATILTVPSTTSFTYTIATGAASPEAGPLSVYERNIQMWYWTYPTLPTTDAMSIVVPDEYLDLIVAYGEARFWSYAHKRGKAADAFSEFELRLLDMQKENTRKRFLAI
jgi:hypothetical protein